MSFWRLADQDFSPGSDVLRTRGSSNARAPYVLTFQSSNTGCFLTSPSWRLELVHDLQNQPRWVRVVLSGMVRGAVERPLWRQVRVLPHTFSLQRLPPAPPVPWACGRAKEATAGPRGAGGGLERRCSTVPPVDALDAAVGWPCASHVHVHGASRGTPVPHAPGGCENAGMAGKGARGRGRAPIGCARVHANDASVGLFRVYNSSCVTEIGRAHV